MLKQGIKSTEWWGVVIVAVLAAAKTMGIVPQDATVDMMAQQGADLIPMLMTYLSSMAGNYGPLLVLAGLVYAYIKRRTALKAKAMK